MTQPATGGASLPVLVDVLAAELVALYARAEQQLLAALATAARQHLRDSAGAAQLAMLQEMRRAAERTATMLRLQAAPLARQVAAEAAAHGEASALALLQRVVGSDPRLARLYLQRVAGASGHGLAAANRIGLELASKLNAVELRIVRFADDAYRAAVADAATRLVLGWENLTPQTAQGLAWDELTRLGVTGFTDSRGRSWNLASYVEMATRTAVQRAYNAAHLDRMTSVGIQYFTVSHDGHPCPLCRPWEGAILSLSHIGEVTTARPDTGKPVTFTVAATTSEAVAAGLMHPNCRHTWLPYLPGVTTVEPPHQWTAKDQRLYDATQRLRALERAVRAAKREQLGAIDDLSRQRAARNARVIQGRIRLHVARHGLVRRPRREQLDLGNR